MIAAALIFLYIVGIGVTGGVTSYVQRLNQSRDDAAVTTMLCGAFWPATLVGCIIVGIVKLTVLVCQVIGRHIGLRLNKAKVTASTIRMMEDDLARVGGNQELMLNWDYRPCHRCYGSGCRDCGDKGVERVKDGIPVTSTRGY